MIIHLAECAGTEGAPPAQGDCMGLLPFVRVKLFAAGSLTDQRGQEEGADTGGERGRRFHGVGLKAGQEVVG